MSFSKLESLPNEILIDIIEKYINGVDVLVALNYQLNQRFNALINGSRRLRFNFIQCQKDDFRFCMGLLPAYIDQIEELAISEKDTPGQVHAFLSFFPSFVPFKRLRTLYFHFDVEAVNWKMVDIALCSLFDTYIHTLSIKKIGTSDMPGLRTVIADIFHLKSLKRFSLIISIDYPRLYAATGRSSNIEHLTVSGIRWNFQNLQDICRIAPRLKYLNVRIFPDSAVLVEETRERSEKNVATTMSVLRTLVLSFERDDSTTLDMLADFLKSKSVLSHLEIKAHSRLLDADRWESVLETSLPLLIHFSLRTTVSYLRKIDLHNILASFQNSFWIAKKNFFIMITEHKDFGVNINDIMHDHDEFSLPVIRYWTAPNRTVDGDLIALNEIKSFIPFDLDNIISSGSYFDNVKHLVLYLMNESWIPSIMTYINCFQIKKLDITLSSMNTDELPMLLASVNNLNSLRVDFYTLVANKNAFIGKVHCLKCLDISRSMHKFNEEDIIIIAELFPYLEHIKINSPNLSNVSVLKMYLLHLRTLTFDISNISRPSFSGYRSAAWDLELRQKTDFLFQCKQNSIIVWVDQATLKDPYWRRFVGDTSITTVTPIGTFESSKNSIINFFKNLFN